MMPFDLEDIEARLALLEERVATLRAGTVRSPFPVSRSSSVGDRRGRFAEAPARGLLAHDRRVEDAIRRCLRGGG